MDKKHILNRKDLEYIAEHKGKSISEPMYIISKCHPKEGCKILYLEGVLRLECSICREVIANIRVDSGDRIDFMFKGILD